MADFTKKFLDEQKKKLLIEKEKIANNFKAFAQETKTEGKNVVSEEGDLAQKYTDQKLNISLREKDLRTLKEIEVALRKMEDGTYGYCEESGEPIERKRLEKTPWARLSLYYAELEEREQQRYYRKSV